jgi:type IV pilus assembly protein PilM
MVWGAPTAMVSKRMFSATKSNAVVGLDIEAGSIAASEVRVNGTAAVTKTGVAQLQPGVFREGEVSDVDALTEALKQLFSNYKLTKVVRLGVANQRVAARALRLPLIEDEEELQTAVRFQAQDHIPMPLDQAVLDYRVVDRPVGPGGDRQMDVFTVAARRDMIEAMLSALRGAGLRAVGIDLSAFGMIRALAGQRPEPAVGAADAGDGVEANGDEAGADATLATLYCNLGDVTNLAIARGTDCLFTRISSFGIEGVAQRLAERRGLTLEHARQWISHVGLERPSDEIEGDAETVQAARETLAEGAAKLVDELRLSLDFYGTQESAIAVDSVVACGPGSAIPGLPARLERELGMRFDVGRPADLSHLDDAAAARLTLSYGLAREE